MTHGSTVLFVSLPVKARVYAVGFAPAAAAGGGAYTHAWTVSAQVVAGRAVGAVTRHWILRQACQPECNRRELRAAAETCLSTLGVKFTFTITNMFTEHSELLVPTVGAIPASSTLRRAIVAVTSMHADVGLIERETAHGTVSQAKLSIDHNVRAFLRARSTDAPAWVNTLWADAYNDAATGRIIATTDEQQPAAPATPRAPTPGSVCEYPELDFGEVFAAEPLVSPEGRQSLLASPVVESPSASDTDEPDYIADHLSTLGTGFEYQPQPVTAAAAAEAAAASGVAAMRSLHAAMWTGDLLPYDVYAVHRATAKTRYAVSRAAYDLACSRPSSPVAALQLGDAYADVRPDKHYLSDDDDDDCADAETSDPESDYTGGGGGGGGETSELSDEEYVRAAATVEAIASGLAAKQRATRHYKRKKRSTGDYTMGYVW